MIVPAAIQAASKPALVAVTASAAAEINIFSLLDITLFLLFRLLRKIYTY